MPSPEPVCSWVAVASADHVARGLGWGIMQVGHGKGAPLRRLHAGDRVAYYSPVRRFGEKEACQAFTALGVVRDERVYQADMGGGFVPFRRDVAYLSAQEAPIHPLLEALSFTRGKRSWGCAFRFGLLKVTDEDMLLIARAMQAAQPAPGSAAARAPVPAAA
jgi:EVE domain